jgi:hypothetical protein
MPDSFAQQFSSSEEERSKLESLGVSTPFGYLALLKASGPALRSHLGENRAQRLAEEADKLITDEQRKQLDQPPKVPGRLGAMMPR